MMGAEEGFIELSGQHHFGRIKSNFHSGTKAPAGEAFVPNSIRLPLPALSGLQLDWG